MVSEQPEVTTLRVDDIPLLLTMITKLGLVELYHPHDGPRASESARQVLADKQATPHMRGVALTVLAENEWADRDIEGATRTLEELVQLRRLSEDWRHLGHCYLQNGNPQQALMAFQRALSIRPSRAAIHDGLAQVYDRLGEIRLSKDHRRKGQWLLMHRIE